MLCLMLFAFTILGWNYFGERYITYLFGVKSILPYRIVFILSIAFGAFETRRYLRHVKSQKLYK
ncbi:alanine:cation symporter family protein [Paenibacillus mangrovi]|uniref:alanine:cation symporter family protein n=1 Tax=Paenibacillus mangrovi TaxID=2931978 RepID=UPI003CC7EEA7